MKAWILSLFVAAAPPLPECFKGFVGSCGGGGMSVHSELSGLIVGPDECEVYPGECGKGFDHKGAVIVKHEWLDRCNFGMGDK